MSILLDTDGTVFAQAVCRRMLNDVKSDINSAARKLEAFISDAGVPTDDAQAVLGALQGVFTDSLRQDFDALQVSPSFLAERIVVWARSGEQE